jgi:hypothetical protein
MSNLRRIMQQLADAQGHPQATEASENEYSVEIPDLHIQEYQSQLERCSKGMLQYEWAWLEEHMEDLKLCLVQTEMLKVLGGKAQVERLLLESKKCQDLLKFTMGERSLRPAFHSHAIISSEHAWEVSQDNVKKAWNF